MPKRRLLPFGHRVRITVIATLTTCLVMFVGLRVAMIGFNRAEIDAARDVLLTELRQAQDEIQDQPANPDLAEIAAADPNVSLALFDGAGRLKKAVGEIPLQPVLGFGKRRFGRVKAVYEGVPAPGGTLVVASRWEARDAMVDRIDRMGLSMWLIATLCVAMVTWFATRAAFTPLERLAKEAEALSGSNLSGRLALNDHGEYASFVQTLNGFLDRIEEGVRREERFVADAAHELRTPLTILRARIETTLKRPRSEPEYRLALETTLVEAERLSRMVELLLQSNASAGSPAQPVDLEAEIERVHARWVDRFQRRGIGLELSTKSVQARILPSEFDVIVDNLLANALRASPEGTSCLLSAGPAGSFARIGVRDQGAGILPESRESVFDRLTRMDSGRTRTEGGFGIGLAVCKRLVESREGSIFIEPTEVGALFVVELPLAG